MPAARILLVDTDTAASSHILDILNGIGYTVTAISKAEDALANVAEHQLVILDVVTGPKSAEAPVVSTSTNARGVSRSGWISEMAIGQPY